VIRRRQGYVGQVGDWPFSLVGGDSQKTSWILAPGS